VADPVTDPALLSKLNASQPVNDPALLQKLEGPKPVSDPALLNKLEPEKPPEGNIFQRAGHAVSDWWSKQPSWVEQAEQYSKSGQEAYKKGGVRAMVMDNLDQGIGLVEGLAGGGVMHSVKAPTLAGNVVQKLVSPGTVSPKAEEAAGMRREAGGTAARDTETTRAALGQYEAKLNALTPAEQLDTLAYMEGRTKGAQIKDPELQKFTDEFRDAMELRRKKIEASDRLSKAGMQEDYVTHYWKDPAKARTFMNKWMSKQGSGTTLKKRSIPTIAEGIKAGLEPLTTNPFEIGMRYVTNMDKYIAMNEMLASGKQAGSVKFFQKGSRNVPEGWSPLKGHLAERQYPGRTQGPPMVAHAPDDWARIWNNHVSQGVYRNAELGQAYDAFRFASNMATRTVLGLSSYHVAAMAKEAVHSGVAKSFSQIAGGVKTALSGAARADADAILRGATITAKGAGALPASLAAPVTRALQGHKFQQVYLGRIPASPDYRHVVDLFEKAGGRAVGKGHAPDYQFSAGGSYFSAWRRGSLKMELRNAMKDIAASPHPVGKAAMQTLEAIGRTFETISAPLFELYIPKLKSGAFYDTMKAWLEANPHASPEEQMVVARKLVDSIDNRFGEMIQDNIMWHTLAKQTATVGMLSYSWNLGTVREILGGGIATLKGLGKGLDLASGKYDPRVAYVIAYPMAAATLNAIYQYLHTGKPPESVEDLMVGQTGGMVPGMGGRGKIPERGILPGYDKDVFGWYNIATGGQSLGQEVYNKLNPLVRFGVDIARQKDWADLPFVRPDPTLPQWLYDYFKHAVDSLDPIALQRLQQGEKKGSAFGRADELLGVRQAPAYIGDSKNYQQWRHYHDTNEWKKVQKREQRQKQQYGGTEQ
jgi:hypothetical protein